MGSPKTIGQQFRRSQERKIKLSTFIRSCQVFRKYFLGKILCLQTDKIGSNIELQKINRRHIFCQNITIQQFLSEKVLSYWFLVFTAFILRPIFSLDFVKLQYFANFGRVVRHDLRQLDVLVELCQPEIERF